MDVGVLTERSMHGLPYSGVGILPHELFAVWVGESLVRASVLGAVSCAVQ